MIHLKNQHKIAFVYFAPHFIEIAMSVLCNASVFGYKVYDNHMHVVACFRHPNILKNALH